MAGIGGVKQPGDVQRQSPASSAFRDPSRRGIEGTGQAPATSGLLQGLLESFSGGSTQAQQAPGVQLNPGADPTKVQLGDLPGQPPVAVPAAGPGIIDVTAPLSQRIIADPNEEAKREAEGRAFRADQLRQRARFGGGGGLIGQRLGVSTPDRIQGLFRLLGGQ